MRRLFVGLVVAATAALVPTWALAGNQEVAEQIAASLRDSGQMHGYKIGVKFQDGTAWLRGQVANQEQMNSALRLAFQTPGVTRVVNNLTVAGQDSAQASATPDVAPMRPIQPLDSALSPEQTPRSVSRDLRVSPNNRPVRADMSAVQQPVTAPQRADRVVSNFVPSPVPQVKMTGLQEPTPAPAPARAAPQPPATTVAFNQPTPAPVQPLTPPAVPVPPAPGAAPTPAPAAATPMAAPVAGAPLPMAPVGAPLPMTPGAAPMGYGQPHMPNYAWPGYAAYPNYAALTYPKQYSPTAWPYIGPFYPYPQVPLGWRKVTLEWSDGWWFLDFDDGQTHGPFTGLFRGHR